jgi:hypothetical protein
MLELVRVRVLDAEFVRAEVPPLPFPDQTFGLALASNVYSHLDTTAAQTEFVAESLRVARALVVLEQVWRLGGSGSRGSCDACSTARNTRCSSAASRTSSWRAS